MKVNEPFEVTDGSFTTDVPENDHAEYNAGTTYNSGDRVIVAAEHLIYESLVGSNLGNTPFTSPNEWGEVSATNRWKAFDSVIEDKTIQANSMRYTFTVPVLTDTLCLIDVVATSIQIIVRDPVATVIYDETFTLQDTEEVVDWYEFFTYSPKYKKQFIFGGLPAYAGYELEVIIDAGANDAEVAQIIPGRLRNIGTTLDGTEIDLIDFSDVEKNAFGRTTLVKKSATDRIRFQYTLRTQDTNRVKELVKRLRATACVWFADMDMDEYGTTIFGVVKSHNIPLKAGGQSFGTLEIEGFV